MRRMLVFVLTLSCFALVFRDSGFSQATSGSITGRVADSTGALVVDATVTATSQATHLKRTSRTNDSGYLLRDLPPGAYSMTVTKAGFKTASREPLRRSRQPWLVWQLPGPANLSQQLQ